MSLRNFAVGDADEADRLGRLVKMSSSGWNFEDKHMELELLHVIRSLKGNLCRLEKKRSPDLSFGAGTQ